MELRAWVLPSMRLTITNPNVGTLNNGVHRTHVHDGFFINVGIGRED